MFCVVFCFNYVRYRDYCIYRTYRTLRYCVRYFGSVTRLYDVCAEHAASTMLMNCDAVLQHLSMVTVPKLEAMWFFVWHLASWWCICSGRVQTSATWFPQAWNGVRICSHAQALIQLRLNHLNQFKFVHRGSNPTIKQVNIHAQVQSTRRQTRIACRNMSAGPLEVSDPSEQEIPVNWSIDRSIDR